MSSQKPASVSAALRNAQYSSTPTRRRKANSMLPLLIFAIFVAVGVFAYIKLRPPGPETPEMASQALAAQNIDISENGFLGEIKANHLDNVHHFLLLGPNAATKNSDGLIALFAGIDTSNIDMLNTLLDALPDDATEATKLLNTIDANDKTPIMEALGTHNPDMLPPLLDHGADIILANHAGETPLIYAIKHLTAADAEQVITQDQRLHKTALSLSIPDASGDTPLFYAIRHQDQKIIDILLKANVDVTQPDGSDITPLMLCAEKGDIATAKRLLAVGAKVDTADKGGNTPLSMAIRGNHIEFVKFLINNGADPDFHTTGPYPIQIIADTEPLDSGLVTYFLSRSKQASIAAPDLLFSAINHKDAPIVTYLIESRLANANSVNAKGETALYRALEAGDEATAMLLIEAGANINKTGVEVTPLVLCVQHNLPVVAKKLIDMGAQINQKTAQGYSIAEMAAYYGDPEILAALLDKGAHIEKSATLLMCIRDGNGKAAATLLAYGARPNIMNNNGDSILWMAANNGQDQAVRALIAYHAIIDQKNAELRMTPLAAAAQAGHLSTVKLLVESGASLEAKDAYGMTPLAHAVYIADPQIVSYLISKGAHTDVKDNQGKTLADLAAAGVDNPDARDAILKLLPH